MSQFYDALETRSPAGAEAAHLAALPQQIACRPAGQPGVCQHPGRRGCCASITSRAALAQLPVTRKYQL